jgi:hypothetical protein
LLKGTPAQPYKAANRRRRGADIGDESGDE